MRALRAVQIILVTIIISLLIGLFITTSIKLNSEVEKANRELLDYKTRCLYKVGSE